MINAFDYACLNFSMLSHKSLSSNLSTG